MAYLHMRFLQFKSSVTKRYLLTKLHRIRHKTHFENRPGKRDACGIDVLIFVKVGVGTSVSRFGEISPLWQNLQSLGQFSSVHIQFGNILNLLWLTLYTFGQIFIDVNG